MRARLRDQRGVTLIELLVTIPTSLGLLLAVGMIMTVAFRQTAKVSDRVDAVQRGRLAMEEITRTVRSQVCPSSGAAITTGADNSVTFYADLSGGTSQPEQRTITYDPNANARTITEHRYTGTGTWPPPGITYSAPPTQTRVLLSNADQVAGVPIFRYYAYTATGAVSSTPLATPLSDADEARVVRISTSFVANPRSEQATQASTFQNQVDVRTADPTKPTESPRCL